MPRATTKRAPKRTTKNAAVKAAVTHYNNAVDEKIMVEHAETFISQKKLRLNEIQEDIARLNMEIRDFKKQIQALKLSEEATLESIKAAEQAITKHRAAFKRADAAFGRKAKGKGRRFTKELYKRTDQKRK